MKWFLMLLFSTQLLADEEILFGPEFTFSRFSDVAKSQALDLFQNNKQLISKYYKFRSDWLDGLWGSEEKFFHLREVSESPERAFLQLAEDMNISHPGRFQENFMNVMKHYCETGFCKVDGFNVHFENFSFDIVTDPNVVEVRMSPMTNEDFLKYSPEIQRVLFDTMKSLNLKPQSLYGSGHVNIDLKTAFNGDLKLLRNFVVDYYNHPGLSFGFFELDPANATPFFMKSEWAKSSFERLIADVDSGKVSSIQDFIDRTLPIMRDLGSSELTNPKYQAIRFRRNRLEIRAFRAQRNARTFYLQTHMFQKKIQHLKKLTDEGLKIPFNRNVGVNGMLESMAQFHYYVKDIGMDKKLIKELIPRRYKFVPTLKFKKWAFRKNNSCSRFVQSRISIISKYFYEPNF